MVSLTLDRRMVEKVYSQILELDLNIILSRLKNKEVVPLEYLSTIERNYKQWLTLTKCYPKESLVPSQMVDIIWHEHILDTKRYQEDCNQIFGYYLHHNPCDALTEQEKEELHLNFSKTRELWEKHFDEELSLNNSFCGKCSSRCKPT